MTSKYAIIIPDGAADEPIEALGGRTILEAAATPNMDRVSRTGRIGIVRTVPDGLEPGSDVAQMSLLGYDPARYYCGRAPIEAAARGIELGDNDWVFRCNLVTVSDGKMVDHSAGQISTEEAADLVKQLNRYIGSSSVRFYAGVSYRHLLVFKGRDFDVRTYPPHDFVDRPIDEILPRGRGCEILIDLIARSKLLFADQDINKVRKDLGENQVSCIWLWGQGKKARLQSFKERFGLRAAAVAAVDLAKGLASLAGLDVLNVPGATGFVDTDYAGKGAAAVKALDAYDLVLIHIEAPDEAGHSGNAELKKKAIEQIDENIVGPVIDALEDHESWRILVVPDHPTPVAARSHSAAPVPFAMAGTGVRGLLESGFSEKEAAKSGFRIDKGHELMEYFLKSG